MSASTLDGKKRIILPGGRPGEAFDIQKPSDGRFLLVRLEKPKRSDRMSRRACMEAMRKAPLKPEVKWEHLRKITREP